MRTPSALSTSIMLSLLIIVAGAMLIIFIQIDRGYKLPNYYQEQNDIIRQTYQKESNISTISKVIPSPSVESAGQKAVEPEKIVAAAPQRANPAATVTPTRTPAQVTPSAQQNDSFARQEPQPLPYDILFDSPWSPYYQPQHFGAMR